MDIKNSPKFPDEFFYQITDRDDGDYLAFLYEEETPIGTLSGGSLEGMIIKLKDHTNKTKQRYVLVQVLESYTGQTVH